MKDMTGLVPAPGKAAPLQRIAIFIHPHVAYGPGVNPGHTFEIGAGSIPATEAVYFDLPLPERVRLGAAQWSSAALLRMMLGMPGYASPKSMKLINTSKPSDTDMFLVATAVQNILSLPSDTYTVEVSS